MNNALKTGAFVMASVASSLAFAASAYDGVWQDADGVLYSIHQNNESIVVAELAEQKGVRTPGNPGIMMATGDEFDFAVSGYAYFVLQTPDGDFEYTRNGDFELSDSGYIVNADGHRLVTRDMAAIPATSDGLELAVIEELNVTHCDPVWGCPPEIEIESRIYVDREGVIYLNEGNGAMYEVDQIKLAWVPPGRARVNDYPIRLDNTNGVSFFYGGDGEGRGRDSAYIDQGMLEQLEYTTQTWEGFGGAYVDDRITLNSITGSGLSREIVFTDDSNAVLTIVCPHPEQFCTGNGYFGDRNLTKVY